MNAHVAKCRISKNVVHKIAKDKNVADHASATADVMIVVHVMNDETIADHAKSVHSETAANATIAIAMTAENVALVLIAMNVHSETVTTVTTAIAMTATNAAAMVAVTALSLTVVTALVVAIVTTARNVLLASVPTDATVTTAVTMHVPADLVPVDRAQQAHGARVHAPDRDRAKHARGDHALVVPMRVHVATSAPLARPRTIELDRRSVKLPL